MTFPSAKSQFYSNDSFECIITYIQNLNVNFSFNRSLLPYRFFDYMQNCSRYENRNVHYLGSGDSIEIPRIELGVEMDTNKSTADLLRGQTAYGKAGSTGIFRQIGSVSSIDSYLQRL